MAIPTPPQGPGQDDPITSTFLLSNLHCASCISHLQRVLFALHPRPVSVCPSLVASCVTVRHDKALSVRDIEDTLEESGFDVCDVTSNGAEDYSRVPNTNGDLGYLDRLLDRWKNTNKSENEQKEKVSKRHVDNCEQCRLEGEKHTSHQDPPATSNQTIDDYSKNEKPRQKTTVHKEPLPLVVVDTHESQDRFRASIAIGGMTCAACVTAITQELEKKGWVRKVAVNLISNNATVEFDGEQHQKDIVESIEDIGYDATLDNVVNLNSTENNKDNQISSRIVDILVHGMFCEHCPSRILTALESFGNRVVIEKPLSSGNPIMRLSYTPQSPNFTIRNIFAKISAVDDALVPSIYHPLTLEERSKNIHLREQQRILIRVLATLIVAIPTFIIGIVFMSLLPSTNAGRMFLMRPLAAGVSRAQWALFIMATPVYFRCADVFHRRAFKELRALWRPGNTTPIFQRFYRFGSMNMLMSLGTSIAYISSVAQLIAAGVHPSSVPDNNVFYFDSVVFLTLFLLVGRLIESYSKSKTGDAVAMLGKLRPTEALLIDSGEAASGKDVVTGEELANGRIEESLKSVNVDLLEFGDIVRILHGASPACDGIVVQGETRDSPISVKITGAAGSSMLDQIVKAVREGQTRRAPMERIADTLTGYFVPFVTLVAICTWLIWLALGYSGALPQNYLSTDSDSWVAWSLQFAIAVFVVACPCGLALAAPTAIFVGGGLAAQHGILAKGGGEAFEMASRLDCVVFDKTGTLTIGGEPVVTDFQVFQNLVELGKSDHTLDSKASDIGRTVLNIICAIEANSSHTIAKALTSFCRARNAVGTKVERVEEIAGKGMKGTFSIDVEEIEFVIGNEQLILDQSVSIIQDIQTTLDTWKSAGKSVAIAAMKGTKIIGEKTDTKAWQLAAIFAISDPIRPEAPGIISALIKRGTDVWMLSGDNQVTASAIGSQIGIPSGNVIAGVLPGQKAEKIQYLQRTLKARSTMGKEHSQKRALVAMVGDGINDSPALTTADVGIAIGSGSDIAISSAEFVLVSSNLNVLLTLLDLSSVVFRRIKFNFFWALVYNLIALPIAAGALYPIVSSGKHVRLDPVWASLAMAASSISVVCIMSGLTYLITGSNRGIGRGLLEFLVLRPQTTVIAAVRNVESATKDLKSVPVGEGSKLIILKIDSASATDPTDAIKELASNYNITKVDVLISNAGILDLVAPALDTPADSIRKHVEVNTIGPFTLIQAFHPLLQASDSPRFFVISSAIGSIASLESYRVPFFAYGLSKAAVNYLVRKLHFENPELISMAFSPGWVQTEMGNGAAVKVGQTGAPVLLEDSVQGLVKLFDEASREKSGTLTNYTGDNIPW
ncbi:hypothetical protein B7494_g4599 [Chlorociboria aeruginascens]|nr:hypothetical protein B7494_g4599 [Chlorociboria aeruginascens]